MAEANLIVKIGALVDSSLDRATRTAVSRIRNLGADLTAVGTSFSLGITAPIIAFGTAAINAGKEIESLKLALASVEGSAAKAEARFRELQVVAKLPGLGVREAVQADLALRAYGLTAERAKEATLAFGNALASAGRGKADLAETVRQFGQLSAAGKLTAENLKPIIERVPQVASILREKFGVATAEALRDLGVTSQQVIDVIIGGLQKLPPLTGGLKNSLENFADTAEQSFAKVGDALTPFVTRFVSEFGEPLLKKIEELATEFKNLPSSTQNALVAIGAVATITGPVLIAFGTLANSISSIILLYGKIPTTAAIANAALAAGPWLALAAAVGFAASQFLKLIEVQNQAKDASRSYVESVEGLERRIRERGVDIENLRDKYRVVLKDIANSQAQGLSISPETAKLYREYRDELLAIAKALGTVTTGSSKSSKESKNLAAGLASVGKEAEKVRAIRFEERSLLNAVIAQESAGALSRVTSRLAELRAELAKIEAAGNPLAAILAFNGKPLSLGGGPLDFLQKQFDAAEKQFKFTEESINLSTRATKDLVSEIAKVPGETQLVEDAWARVAGVINRVPDSIRVFNRSQTQAAINAGNKASKEFDKQQKEQERAARENQRHIERYFHRTAQAMADVIFRSKSVGQAFRDLGKEILRSLATAAIENQLKKLTGLLLDFGASLGKTGVGKVLGGIFGADLSKNAGGLIIKNATGAATSAASGAAGAASSASGAAGSVAAGIASSGLTAAVGAVAGAVTAVSSVISNFQLAGVNKSLDLIEKEVRYSQIHLLNLLEQANKYWPWMQFTHERLREFSLAGLGVYNTPGRPLEVTGAAGGGSGANFNFDFRNAQFGGGTTREAVEEMFSQAARQLVLAGAVAG